MVDGKCAFEPQKSELDVLRFFLMAKSVCVQFYGHLRREQWHHSFDPVKYKHYEGSLLKKINFSSKVYSKSLLKGLHEVDCPT